MPKYEIQLPADGLEGSPYCVVAYKDALGLAVHLSGHGVALGMTMAPTAGGVLFFPASWSTDKIAEWQGIVDLWETS